MNAERLKELREWINGYEGFVDHANYEDLIDILAAEEARQKEPTSEEIHIRLDQKPEHIDDSWCGGTLMGIEDGDERPLSAKLKEDGDGWVLVLRTRQVAAEESRLTAPAGTEGEWKLRRVPLDEEIIPKPIAAPAVTMGQMREIAGELSTHDFADSHPDYALEWLVKYTESIGVKVTDEKG